MRRSTSWLGLGGLTLLLTLACGGGGDGSEGGGLLGASAPARIEEIGPDAGTWETVVGDFAATTAIAAMNGKLYVVCNGLYEVDPDSGEYTRLGSGKWKDTHHMTALDGSLYMEDGGTIWKTATDGTWETVVDDFAATTAMVAMNGKLYVVCNGLYEVDPDTGAYARLGDGSWAGTRSMTALDGSLYMVDGGTIYKTATDGTWAEVVGDFAATLSMVSMNGYLYVVCNGLYRVDPDTGEYARLGSGSWAGTKEMAPMADHLYMVDGGTIYRTMAW